MTDFLVRILVYNPLKRVNDQVWSNIGVLFRDPKATLDWSAADKILRKICRPRPKHGNWTKFFNMFDFDWDATCP